MYHIYVISSDHVMSCDPYRSQQKVADMKQVSSLVKDSVWVEDKSITDCKGCCKTFSVSRRKVRGHCDMLKVYRVTKYNNKLFKQMKSP